MKRSEAERLVESSESAPARVTARRRTMAIISSRWLGMMLSTIAAALPVAAQTAPAPGEANPARVQVVDKAAASAQAQSAKQGAKAAKAKKKAKKGVKKGDRPTAAKAG